MNFLLALLEKIGLGALSAWLGHKTDVAEQAGETKQALKDQSAGYEELSKAADARADADVAAVLRQPDAGKSDPASAKQQFPGVEFRD